MITHSLKRTMTSLVLCLSLCGIARATTWEGAFILGGATLSTASTVACWWQLCKINKALEKLIVNNVKEISRVGSAAPTDDAHACTQGTMSSSTSTVTPLLAPENKDSLGNAQLLATQP